MRLTHRLAALIAALVLTALLPVATAAAATQEAVDAGDLVIVPAEGSSVAEGGWFQLDTQPGETVQQGVALRNNGATAKVVRLAAVDAATGSVGGVSFGAPEDELIATAAWITLDADRVELAPGEWVVVGFSVAVPEDTAGGQHLAGIAVWQPAEDTETTVATDGDASASIVVQTRNVIAVQVDLPGGAGPQLVIEDVEVLVRPDGLYLGLHLANTGSELTRATGRVTMPAGTIRQISVDTFVPGTTTVYPVRWTDATEDGSYPVAVELDYAGTTATFADQVVVGDAIQSQLADRHIVIDGGGLLPTSWLIALVAAALVAGILTLHLRGSWSPRAPRRPVARPPQPHMGATPVIPAVRTSDRGDGWSTPVATAPSGTQPVPSRQDDVRCWT